MVVELENKQGWSHGWIALGLYLATGRDWNDEGFVVRRSLSKRCFICWMLLSGYLLQETAARDRS